MGGLRILALHFIGIRRFVGAALQTLTHPPPVSPEPLPFWMRFRAKPGGNPAWVLVSLAAELPLVEVYLRNNSAGAMKKGAYQKRSSNDTVDGKAKSISQHFETMTNHCWFAFPGGIIVARCLVVRNGFRFSICSINTICSINSKPQDSDLPHASPKTPSRNPETPRTFSWWG